MLHHHHGLSRPASIIYSFTPGRLIYGALASMARARRGAMPQRYIHARGLIFRFHAFSASAAPTTRDARDKLEYSQALSAGHVTIYDLSARTPILLASLLMPLGLPSGLPEMARGDAMPFREYYAALPGRSNTAASRAVTLPSAFAHLSQFPL